MKNYLAIFLLLLFAAPAFAQSQDGSIIDYQGGSGGSSGGGAVSSVFGRTGAVVAASNDYNFNQLAGSASAAQMPAFSGDVTSTAGATVLTLATVNSNTGSCGDATHVCQVTLNAKGLATAATAVLITGSGSSVSVTAATPDIVITPSPGTGTFTIGTTAAQRTVTIASDTILTTDAGKTVQYTNTGGTVAISFPTVATLGTGFKVTLCSGPIASASPLTVTPVAGSSIMWNGGLVTNPSNFPIPANTCSAFSSPNGTNWASLGAAPVITDSATLIIGGASGELLSNTGGLLKGVTTAPSGLTYPNAILSGTPIISSGVGAGTNCLGTNNSGQLTLFTGACGTAVGGTVTSVTFSGDLTASTNPCITTCTATSTLVHSSYVSGRFYMPPAAAIGGASTVNGSTITYFIPIYFTATATMSELCQITHTLSAVGGGADKASWAIYADDGSGANNGPGSPSGSPVSTSKDISTTATGVICQAFTGSATQVFMANTWYWEASQIDNSTALLEGMNANAYYNQIYRGVAASSDLYNSGNLAVGYKVTGTVFDTFPTSPTLVQASAASMPISGFEVQ